jgi:hypothetical protein
MFLVNARLAAEKKTRTQVWWSGLNWTTSPF